MTDDQVANVRRTPIADVIAASGLTVVGSGKVLTTKQHDSLRIFLNTNSFYWFSQGFGGGVIDWVIETQHVDFRTACDIISGQASYGSLSLPAVKVEPPPPPLAQDLHIRLHQHMSAADIEWWLGRGLSQTTQRDFWLGSYAHPHWGLCYTIPVLEDNKLVNIRLRLAKPADPKDKYRPWAKGYGTQLYNRDIVAGKRGVVVVAGEIKAAALTQEGIPAVSPTAGCHHWKAEWTRYLAPCEKIYVAFDPGEEEAGEELAEAFGPKARYVMLNAKPDDFLFQYGVDAIRYHLKHALPVAEWRKACKVQIPPDLATAFYDPRTYERQVDTARVPWRSQLWQPEPPLH